MDLQGVLFDFDGLILDTETPEFTTIAEVFTDHGVSLTLAEWTARIGRGDNPDWTEMLVDALGSAPDGLEDLRRVWRERLDVVIAQEAVRPGVLELADAATAAGVGVAVASSSSSAWVEGHLARLGVADRFGPRATRDDVGHARAKPNPDLFLLAADRLGVDPRGCVVLEDSQAGVTAGNAAGCVTVAVPGAMTADLDFSHADHVVSSVADLDLDRLQAMVGGSA